MPSYSFKTIVLVGGKGSRLDSVTQGKIPKGFVEINKDKTVRGVDHLNDILARNGIQNAIFSTRNYSEPYETFVRGKSHAVFYQSKETGTSGAIEEIFEEYGYEHQYLVMSGDVYCHYLNIAKLLQNHVPGTISWGVTSLDYPLMEPYHGLIVKKNSHAIIGDSKLPWWQEGDLTDTDLYVKSAVNIIDPVIYRDAVRIFQKKIYKEYPLDLYWDILPCFEDHNRKRVAAEEPSLLQAVKMDYPFIDYGTPERLELTRAVYEDQIFPVFEPINGNFLHYQDRIKVHTIGDWHKGIQAHVVRPNNAGTFDVLIQVRSTEVDISKGRYDQSLATQMLKEDNLSEFATLCRGLSTELGIHDFTQEKLEVELRIIKTYQQEVEVLNREMLSLFLVHVSEDAQIASLSSKIEQLLWVDWDSLIEFFENNPSQFTKTAQFYLGNPLLRKNIESATYRFLEVPMTESPTTNLADSILLHVDLAEQPAQTFVHSKHDTCSLQRALEEWPR